MGEVLPAAATLVTIGIALASLLSLVLPEDSEGPLSILGHHGWMFASPATFHGWGPNGGTFTPLRTDLAIMEEGLDAYLAERSAVKPEGVAPKEERGLEHPPATYFRQYSGRIAYGRSQVHVHGLCPDSVQYQCWLQYDDQRECAFEVYWDVQSRRFHSLTVYPSK
ncbi:MAG: hypothetical protein AAGF12_30310 [Myxococcota bacterium]